MNQAIFSTCDISFFDLEIKSYRDFMEFGCAAQVDERLIFSCKIQVHTNGIQGPPSNCERADVDNG
jgi:hypothetical protein